MAFERAKIEIKAAAVGSGLKVTLAKIKGTPARMKFSLTTQLAKQFGWSDGDKLEVLIGTGGDHGALRFRKNNSTGDAVASFRKGVHPYVSVSLGHQPAFVDRAEAGRWCQFEQLEDGWLEVILPRWADETAARKVSVSSPAAAPPSAGQPDLSKALPKKVVTSTIMGDPPIGRREMLSKMGEMKV